MALNVQVIVSAIDRMTGPLAKMEKQTSSWQQRMTAVGLGVGAAGTAITGVFTGMIMQTTRLGDELDGLMKRTGMSADALTTLQYAAKQTDVEVGALAMGIRFLQRNTYGATQGNAAAAKGFHDLGISVKDSSGKLKSTETLLLEVADALVKVRDPAARTGIAIELFGRSGQAMLPMLSAGAKGIRELQEQARKLGFAWSDEEVAKADEFAHSMDRLRAATGGLSRQIATQLIPGLTEVSTSASVAVANFGAWSKEHQTLSSALIGTFGVGGPILVGLGALLAILPRIAEGWALVASAAKLAAGWEGVATAGAGGVLVAEMGAIGYYGPTGGAARAKGAAKGRSEMLEHALRGEKIAPGQSPWSAVWSGGPRFVPMTAEERARFQQTGKIEIEVRYKGEEVKKIVDLRFSNLMRNAKVVTGSN